MRITEAIYSSALAGAVGQSQRSSPCDSHQRDRAVTSAHAVGQRSYGARVHLVIAEYIVQNVAGCVGQKLLSGLRWMDPVGVPVVGARLRENRAKLAPRRTQWERFVAVRVDAQQASATAPVLAVGALAGIDRHYNSLAPYRANQPNIYAVRSGSMLMLRYVDFDDRHLILRPFLREFPVQLIGLREGESPADYVVGRVCLVVAEV